MLLVVLLLVSKAGAVCVGGPQDLRTDEVLVMCPLSEDVRLTRRGVVISHFTNHDQSNTDTMMSCDWLARHFHNLDCRSRFHFTLTSLQKDCVMARMPRAQLHKEGFYQCQLVPPPDADHAFSRCLVYDNDDTDDPTTTLSPVIPAADQPWPRDPMEKVLTDDHPGDNSVLVAGLTSAGVILLALIVVFVAFMILRHRRHRRTVSQTSEPSLEKGQQPLMRTVPLMSEPSLEKEEQPLMRTVPQTSETSPEKEQQPLVQNVQRAPEIPQDLEQQLRRIAQRLSDIFQAMDQQSSGTVPRTSETSLEKEQQPLILQGNGAKDSRDLPGDVKAVSALNHPNSFKDNGATDCSELPGDEAAANTFICNDYRIKKKNAVTDVRAIPGDEAAANVWTHSDRFKWNSVTDVRDLLGDGEPMYGITSTGLRRTESQTSETSLDMCMDMQSIYGTTPTGLRKRSASFGEKETQPRYLIPERMIASDVSRSATRKQGHSRLKYMTGKQPRRELPKPTNPSATKALLKRSDQ